MKNAKTLFFVVLGVVVVAGCIMAAIYIVQGGEGDSTNIPGNDDARAPILVP